MNEHFAILSSTADRIFGDAGNRAPGSLDGTVWSALVDTGFDRLLAPEMDGGGGGAFAEAVAAAMRLGANAASVPLLETIVANWCLGKAGLDADSRPKALLFGRDVALTGLGTVTWPGALDVPWEPVSAATLAFPTREQQTYLAVVASPLTGIVGRTLADEPLRRAAAPEEGVEAERLVRWPLDPALPMALLALLKAAAIAGAAETILAMTIEYAHTRRQFGRSIASFQAIQHMIARMAEEAAAAGAAVQHAAIDFSGQHPIGAAAIAKGRASEAASVIASNAHQIHGAIGYAAEHDLHRFTKRLLAWREEAGHEAYWYERIGRAACGRAPSLLWPDITEGLINA